MNTIAAPPFLSGCFFAQVVVKSFEEIGFIVIIFFVVTGLIALGMVLLYFQREGKRTANLEALADRLACNFRRNEADGDRALFEGLPLFSRGRRQKLENILIPQATTDPYVMIFDYSFTVGSGKSTRTNLQTIVSVTSPRLNLPAFTLHREYWSDRVGEKLGMSNDIDFEDHPVFSKKYSLNSKDEDAVRTLFRPDIREQLEGMDPPVSMEAVDHRVIFYRGKARLKPGELIAFHEQVLELARRFMS